MADNNLNSKGDEVKVCCWKHLQIYAEKTQTFCKNKIQDELVRLLLPWEKEQMLSIINTANAKKYQRVFFWNNS